MSDCRIAVNISASGKLFIASRLLSHRYVCFGAMFFLSLPNRKKSLRRGRVEFATPGGACCLWQMLVKLQRECRVNSFSTVVHRGADQRWFHVPCCSNALMLCSLLLRCRWWRYLAPIAGISLNKDKSQSPRFSLIKLSLQRAPHCCPPLNVS